MSKDMPIVVVCFERQNYDRPLQNVWLFDSEDEASAFAESDHSYHMARAEPKPHHDRVLSVNLDEDSTRYHVFITRHPAIFDAATGPSSLDSQGLYHFDKDMDPGEALRIARAKYAKWKADNDG